MLPLPLPLRLVREHKISLRMIARAADCSAKLVRMAMNPITASSVSEKNTAIIRDKIEQQLRLFGHEFAPGELWKEYDQIEEAA